MLVDPLQDIDQAVIRIDVVEVASGKQTLHDADLIGTQFCPVAGSVAAGRIAVGEAALSPARRSISACSVAS
jgi:hypothetical protein